MHPRPLFLIAAWLAAFAIACGGDDDASDGTTATPGGAIATSTGAPTSAPPTEAPEATDVPEPTATVQPTATPEPTVEVKPTEPPTPEPGAVDVSNEPVSIEAPDGTVLQGRLYNPQGPMRQALIIVAPVDQATWAESTQAFTSQGAAVLTFDPRGFGLTGGEPDPAALAADTELVTRFVASREFPLIYLLGVGQEGGAAAAEAAANVEAVNGLLTYGYTSETTAPYELPLAPDATWNGENILADQAILDMATTFVLGAN